MKLLSVMRVMAPASSEGVVSASAWTWLLAVDERSAVRNDRLSSQTLRD